MESRFKTNELEGKDSWKAVALVLLAFFLQAVDGVATKLAVTDLSSVQVTFFRFSLGALVLWVTHATSKSDERLFPTAHLHLHLWRSLLGITAVVTAIYSIRYLSLGDQTALGYLNPILLSVLAFFILRERIPPLRWMALLLGLTGVLLIAGPSWTTATLPLVLFLLGRVGAAVSDIFVRILRDRSQTPRQIVFFYFLLGTMVMCLFLPSYWTSLQPKHLPLIAYIGVSGALFQVLYTKAIGELGASTVAPFTYTTLGWAVVFDAVIWGVVPTIWGIAGALLVVSDVGCTWWSIREMKLDRREGKAP